MPLASWWPVAGVRPAPRASGAVGPGGRCLRLTGLFLCLSSAESSRDVGYLAQHQLFDQVSLPTLLCA